MVGPDNFRRPKITLANRHGGWDEDPETCDHEGSLGLDLNGIALDPDLKCTDRLPGGPAADSARGHIKLAPVARTSHDRPLQLSSS